MRLTKGDIFKATFENGKSRYMQYILDDPCQLNSNVVRIFNFIGDKDVEYPLNEIISSNADFYTHVIVKWGLEYGFWTKIGNYPIENEFQPPKFRDVFDLDIEVIENKIQYHKTNKWQIWQAGNPFSSRKNIGFLTNEYKKTELGIIFSPGNVYKRMQDGSFLEDYYF